MKIAFFTENLYRGGLDTFLVTLIEHWPRADDQLVLMCNRSHPGFDYLQTRLASRCEVVAHDIAIYPDLVSRTQRWRLTSLIRQALSPLLRYGYLAWYCARLPGVFRLLKADRLVVVNGGHSGGDSCRAAVFSWTGQSKPLYCFHNLSVPPRWHERALERRLDRLLFRSASYLASVSKACAQSLANRPSLASAPVQVIYNGIVEPDDMAEKPHNSLHQAYELPADARICLMLATYEPRKGHEFLLRAFRRVIESVPQAHLVMCGSGYEHEIERVRAAVVSLGLASHVRVEGYRDDAMSLLRQAHALVVPSQSFESFGLTIVEAMARRVPVVATNVGGIPEVLNESEGGYCVNADDESGFASALTSLLTDRSLAETQGELGYRRYRDIFTARRMAEAYAELVRES